MDRRNLLKVGGALSIGAALSGNIGANTGKENFASPKPRLEEKVAVDLSSDGRVLSPFEYAQLLQKLIEQDPRIQDQYGRGGAVEKLERKFVKITGAGLKESHVHDVQITRESPNYRIM